MFFSKKKKSLKECSNCNFKIEEKFSFCPYCGADLVDREKEERNFGLIGRDDNINFQRKPQPNMSLGEKLMDTMFNSLVKALGKQLNDIEKDTNRAEITPFPNGIQIRVAAPLAEKQQVQRKRVRSSLTKEQIEKMSKLPRAIAKSDVKRLNNKIVYELSTPGIQTVDDILFSKTESGYEIKAIGKSKIYVNSIPINLPLRKISINENKTFIEFH